MIYFHNLVVTYVNILMLIDEKWSWYNTASYYRCLLCFGLLFVNESITIFNKMKLSSDLQ